MQEIIYDGINGKEFGAFASEFFSLPVAQTKKENIEVAGRDGELTIESDVYEAKEFDIPFNFIAKNQTWHEKCENIKTWLAKTNCKLIISDDPAHFYKVDRIEVKEIMRPSKMIGVFKATVHTKDGLRYLVSGENAVEISEAGTKVKNEFLHCMPRYEVVGNGVFTIQIVDETNIVECTGQVSGDMVIDTEKMLAYRKDGTSQNTLVKCDYEKMRLHPGEVTIKAQKGIGSTATVTLIPNWRCL